MHVNVTIIGLDRLGTSLGLALKRYEGQPKAEHSFTIIGNDPKIHPMKTAKKLGAVDNFHRAVLKAMTDADLVIANAPCGMIEDLYASIGPDLKPGAVVLDTAVLKQPVIECAGRYFPTNEQGMPLAYLVGITPIVNVNGLYGGDLSAEAARADLFDGAEFLVTPDAKCPSEAIALSEDVLRLIGGKPRFMDPVEHDGLVAATEGLPALLGVALFYTLQQSEGWMELRRMVNPSLALATQNLRYQSPQDLFALFMHNRDNLARHLEGLIGTLDQVRDSLLAGDEEAGDLEAFLSVVHNEWEKWDVKRHSGKWDESQKVELLPGPFGFGRGFLNLTRRGKAGDAD